VDDTSSQKPQASERSTEFVPFSGNEETSNAGTLLVVAYLLMWAAVFGFLFLSWRRQRKIDARLGELEQALKKADSKGS
jgi:CcmD family protein